MDRSPQNFLLHYLDEQKQNNLYRTTSSLATSLINFASNDYFGLSSHPAVKTAAIKAINTNPISTCSSKYISGYSDLHQKLETALSQLKGMQNAVLFGSGYLACSGTLSALANPKFESTTSNLIFADKYIHASLLDGAINSRAKLIRFSHNNANHLSDLLKQYNDHDGIKIIVTESVFSMQGDLAPLDQILELAVQHQAFLVIDDAHGLWQEFSSQVLNYPFTVIIGTLSKSVGCFGGYICGTNLICEYIKNFARTQIFATSLPYPIIAASIAALDIISTQGNILRYKITQNIKHLARSLHFETPHSHIIMIKTEQNPAQAINLSKLLELHGIHAKAVRPPTVPLEQTGIRLTLCSWHTDTDITLLYQALSV